MNDRKPNKSSIFSRLEITAISLALISAVLYSHGTIFHRAYLESFGLSDEVFPLSADEAMMRGFEAYLLMATRTIEKIDSLRPWIAIAIVSGVAVLVAVADSIIGWSWVRRTTGKIARWFYYTPEEHKREIPRPILDFAFKLFWLFGPPLLLLLFIIFATASLLTANGRTKAEIVRLACDHSLPQDVGQTGLTIFSMSASVVTVDYEQPGSSTPMSARGCVVAAVPEFIAIYEKTGTIAIAKARIISIKASTK
jgi:hypothetical protein